jgi:TonB family protein
MHILKTPLALLASLAILPAQADGIGRADKAVQKQIAVDLNSCPKPVWPPDALRREQQGTVTLAYLIGLDGSVQESRIEKSSGYPLLDLAAQDGIAKCKFTLPGSVGRNEPTWTRMQYVWSLQDSKTPEQQQADWERDLALAEQGDAAAKYRLSGGYMIGRPGVERNRETAVRLLREAAELGYAKAQESLGFMLLMGKGVDRNLEEARMWTEKAAAQGQAAAQISLATMLLAGRDVPQDKQRARELLEKVAAQGNIMAKSMLGSWLISEGGEPEQGLQLLEEAAAQHERLAQLKLAEVLEKGELRPQDKARAIELYRRAAAAGLTQAQRALVRLTAEAAR